MTEALKPCPFCGVTPDIKNPATFQDSQGTKWGSVVCCCTGPEVRTGYGLVEDWRDEAIAEWNSRVDPDAWQPEETAPDQVNVLVYDGENIYVAERIDSFWGWVDKLRGRYVGPDSMVGDPDGPKSSKITHWKPLPKPPEDA